MSRSRDAIGQHQRDSDNESFPQDDKCLDQETLSVGIKKYRQMSKIQANALGSLIFVASAMRGALPFWSRGTPKRKQKGLVPTRINSVGIVVPNKAIASKRLRSNLHAYFSQCWGRVCVYCFYLIYYLAYVLCFKAKIAVPVLRSLSLYWNRLNIYVVLFVPLNVFNLKKFHLAGAFNRR